MSRIPPGAAPWVERFTRAGYATKGSVYITVGVLAAKAAVGRGGRTTGAKGALATILSQPLGQILLSIVVLGLVGYSLSRFLGVVIDSERKGSGAKGLAVRSYYLVSGLAHASLAYAGIRMLRGARESGGDENLRSWTGWLLSLPHGVKILYAIGALLVGSGIYQLYKAWVEKLDKRLDLSTLRSASKIWVFRVARFGMAARGVVFIVIGTFLIRAAKAYSPNQARGVGGAFDALRDSPYGKWVLVTVACGFVAYGLYEIVRARYRRITPV